METEIIRGILNEFNELNAEIKELNDDIKKIKQRINNKEKRVREVFPLLIEKFLDKHLTLECNKYSCEENCKIEHKVPPKTIVILHGDIFILSKDRGCSDLGDIIMGTLIAEDVKFLQGGNNIDDYVCSSAVSEYLDKKGYWYKTEKGKFSSDSVTYYPN